MFEIISYGGGNLIYQILQGVAMFFGSSDYLFTMKIVATMASVAILIQSAFTGRIPDLKWLLIIIFVYMFVFVPKVTVTVTDTVERSSGFAFSAPTPTVRVVGNVPIGLAFVASFTSHMKDYFVKGAETVFSLPGEMSYRTAGPLFAQGIAEKSLSTAPQSPSTVASLSNFWRDCVFYDIALGFYSLDELSHADDLEDFLRTNVNNNRFYQHNSTNGAQSFVGCRASMQTGGAMRVALDAEKKEQSQWVSWYNNLATKPAASSNNAMMASGAAAMPVAMSYLTGMSITSSRLLGQTILSNSFANGLTSFASQSEASEVMQSYAAAKAEAERSVTFSTLGKISGRMLPLMNIIAEALIYAVFPIVALFMLWPGGHKAAGAYVMALIWIALWAPMYAVVHFISAFYSSISVGSAAQICDATNTCAAHLNMYTMRSMKEAFANAAAISGFMATMVPYLAYMVVSKSGAMMAGTVGRLMDGYSQPVSHAAGEAAAGNVSMGGMNYENQTAFQHNSAPSQSSGYMSENSGRNTHLETSRVGIDQMNLDKGAYSMSASSNVQSQVSRQHDEATKMTQSTQASFAEAQANRLGQVSEASQAISHATGTGTTHGMDKSAGTRDALSNISSEAQKYGESHGVNASYMTAAMAELGAKLPGVAGINASARDSEEYQKATQVAKEYLTSQQFNSSMDKAESAYMQQTASQTDSVTRAGREAVSNASEQSVRAEQSYSAAVSREEAVRKTESDITSQGATAGADVGRYVKEKVEADGGNWEQFNNSLNSGDQAALSKLDAYKNDFAQQYVAQRVNQSEADISAKGDAAMAGVTARGDTEVGAATTAGSAVVSQENSQQGTTERDGNKIKSGAASRAAESNAKHEHTSELTGAYGAKVEEAGYYTTGGAGRPVAAEVEAAGDTSVVGRTADRAADGLNNTVEAATGVDLYKAGEKVGLAGEEASDTAKETAAKENPNNDNDRQDRNRPR